MQTEISAAANVSDAFPAGHMLQVLACENCEYVPARHDAHVFSPDTAENLPGRHMLQNEISVAATVSDAFPAAQLVQVSALNALDISEYVPARHDTHVFGPAIAVYFPAGHILQTEISVAPTVSDAFPAGHMLQVLTLGNSEYVPARHDTHVF